MSFHPVNYGDSHSPELMLFEAMSNKGLPLNKLPVADSVIHRFHVEGDKKDSKNGWYVFHMLPSPVASYGNWKTGQSHIWYLSDNRLLSRQEKEKLAESISTAIQQRRREQLEKQSAAAMKAETIFARGDSSFGHFLYLDDMKKVGRHGDIRKLAKEIMLPICDVDGNLMSLQFIDENGNKRFLPKGRIKGGCYLIGSLGRMLCIAEGYATGASFYEFSEKHLPVAIAFNSGNLKAVAMAFKKKFPHLQIIILADNDRFTEGNPGKRKAYEAAKAVGGHVYLPPFEDDEPGTDFNDWLNLRRNRHGN